MQRSLNQTKSFNYQLRTDNYSQTIAFCLQRLGNGLAFFLVKHWLGLINLFLVVIILGTVFAPYLASLGHLSESKIIYSIYHLTCLQKENRCLYIFGHKMGLCIRCFFIYLSLLTLGLLWSILARLKTDIKPIKFKLAFLFFIPLILDGTSQILGLRESTNFLRMITGILFSLGIVLSVYARVKWETNKLSLILKRPFR